MRPVVATDVHDQFDELVAQESGHQLVSRRQQLAEGRSHLHLVVSGETNPPARDDVLKVTTRAAAMRQ